MKQSGRHFSSIGNLEAKNIVLIAYGVPILFHFIFGFKFISWLIPLCLYFLEKDSNFVKFHAMQSFLLNVLTAIVTLIANLLTGTVRAVFSFSLLKLIAFGINGILGLVFWIIGLILLIAGLLALYQGYHYKFYKLPLIGEMASNMN